MDMKQWNVVQTQQKQNELMSQFYWPNFNCHLNDTSVHIRFSWQVKQPQRNTKVWQKKKEKKERKEKSSNEKTPCWSTGFPSCSGAERYVSSDTKHGGVRGAITGCSCLNVVINFCRHVIYSPKCCRNWRRCLGDRGDPSPPLRVQVQLQRTPSVSEWRLDPILDPHWK